MKKLAIAVAALSVAAVFNACGDDSSSSSSNSNTTSNSDKVYCSYDWGYGMTACVETSFYAEAEKECAEGDGKMVSSCASGEDLKCEIKNKDGNGTGYIYGIPAEKKDSIDCSIFDAAEDDDKKDDDSSDSDKVSCTSTTEAMGMKTCIEISSQYAAEAKEACAEKGGVFGTGCASGEALKCELKEDDDTYLTLNSHSIESATAYMYDIPAEMKDQIDCGILNDYKEVETEK